MKDIPISKARNLYLAHCAAENKFKSIPAAVAAFNFFLGKQIDSDRDIEKSLLDSASRTQTPTNHRSGAKQTVAPWLRAIVLQRATVTQNDFCTSGSAEASGFH